MRVVAELSDGRVHVSELARRLGISRPLLYMHLDRLEKAGLVSGHLELSTDGKAMKYFELAPFELSLTAATITEAVRASLEGMPAVPTPPRRRQQARGRKPGRPAAAVPDLPGPARRSADGRG